MTQPKQIFAVRGEGTDTLELDVYDVVGGSWWSDGVTAKGVRSALKSNANAKTIKLRVNSRGGDVFEGTAIYNLLRDHPANVVADVDALAASIASVILMAADEIRIAPGAMVMIHNPWAISLGEADDLRSTADLLDKVRGQMADIYAARTGLAHERLLEMMAAETWMTPEEAKANGFADVIKSASQGATKARALAALDLSGLTVPRDFNAAVERARAELATPPNETTRAATPPPPDDAPAGGERPNRREGPSAPSEPRQEKNSMEKLDLRTLRSQHPDLFEAAVQEGVKEERDRVCAHLTMGEQSGDLKTAFGAIRAGDGMTQTLTATYLAAGMNRAEQTARQTETDQAGDAVAGAEPAPEEQPDLGAQVIDIIEARRGKKAEG